MANRVPEPLNTPKGPMYEGRLLARPEDEVVDQGAGFDMQTLLSRRVLLGAGIAGLGSVALVACSSDGTASSSTTSSNATSASSATAVAELPSAEIPDETAGPYPGDGSNGPDVLENSGIVRADIRSSIGASDPVAGVPLEFTITVIDMANGDAPFANAAVYAWHCDSQGRYSMYSEGTEDETWLRGVQVADADGKVTFTSIIPACYTGRWPHIHFEVYSSVDDITDADNAIAISQIALPESILAPIYALSDYDGSAANLAQVSLDTDNVFGDDGGELQVATVSGDLNSGYIASLVVRVDTTTQVEAGAAPGNPGEGGGPGGTPPDGAPGAPGAASGTQESATGS